MLQVGYASLRLNPGRAPSSPRALHSSRFHARCVRVRAPSSRKGAAKGPNSVLRAEMAFVPGIFLVRTKNFWYGTVCPYKMIGTLVRWHGTKPYQTAQAYYQLGSTKAVPDRSGLNVEPWNPFQARWVV